MVPNEPQQEKSATEIDSNTDDRLGDAIPEMAPTGNLSRNCQANGSDASSVASGVSSMLSLSPVLSGGRGGGSRRALVSKKRSNKLEPKCEILPPYVIDAQLVTKKVGKECQRLLLLRMYRERDIASAECMDRENENDDEAYDLITPLSGTSGIGSLADALYDNGDDDDEDDYVDEANRIMSIVLHHNNAQPECPARKGRCRRPVTRAASEHPSAR